MELRTLWLPVVATVVPVPAHLSLQVGTIFPLVRRVLRFNSQTVCVTLCVVMASYSLL